MTPRSSDDAEKARRALDDFLDFAGQIDDHIVSLGEENYLADPLARLASEALVAKLGEAATRLPPTYREAHPEIAWSQLRGMRNIVAHAYGQIDHRLIWNALTDHLPQDVERVLELRRRL